MANRAMLAKVERAARQRREAGAIEGSKPLNQSHNTIGAANAKRVELGALIAAYKGVVTVCPKPVHELARVRGGMVQGGSLLPAGGRARNLAVAAPTWAEYARQREETPILVRV